MRGRPADAAVVAAASGPPPHIADDLAAERGRAPVAAFFFSADDEGAEPADFFVGVAVFVADFVGADFLVETAAFFVVAGSALTAAFFVATGVPATPAVLLPAVLAVDTFVPARPAPVSPASFAPADEAFASDRGAADCPFRVLMSSLRLGPECSAWQPADIGPIARAARAAPATVPAATVPVIARITIGMRNLVPSIVPSVVRIVFMVSSLSVVRVLRAPRVRDVPDSQRPAADDAGVHVLPFQVPVSRNPDTEIFRVAVRARR